MQYLAFAFFLAVVAKTHGDDRLTSNWNPGWCYSEEDCRVKSEGLPPRMPHIGYLGGTYNLFKGNPLSVGSLDPGFLGGQQLYQFFYSNRTTTDGSYLIPDGSTVYSIESCTFSFSSSITKTSESYSDSLKVHVDAQFKGWGASFSASADFQKVSQSTSTGESIYISSHAQCQTYGASFDDAVLSEAFTYSVEQLPASNADLEPYLSFIESWGTHVTDNMIMGGRYGIRSEFETSTFDSLSSTKFNFKAAGGYSGIVSVNADLATEKEKEEASKYDESRKNYELYVLGGTPPISENGSVFEWVNTVKESPLPLSYSLVDIYKYFNEQNFPNDTQIDQKRENLKAALKTYCLDNVPNTAYCNIEYGPSDDNKRMRASFNNYFVNASRLWDSVSMPYSPYNPNMRSFGYVYNVKGTNFKSMVMVDVKSVTANFSVPPTGIIDTGAVSPQRYLCPDGYTTLTDSIGSGYILPDKGKGSYPLNAFTAAQVHCVSKHCVEPCSQGVECYSSNCFFIGGGYPELGNSGFRGFWRDLGIPDSTSRSDLFQCLTYQCLEVLGG